VPDKNQQYDHKELAEKLTKGQLSPEEQEWLDNWYLSFDDDESSLDNIHHDVQGLRDRMLSNIKAEVGMKSKPSSSPAKLYAIAATILLAIGISFLFYKYHDNGLNNNAALANIRPGGNKAYLTLADGRKIALSEAHTGEISNQGNATVSKTADGSVRYNADAKTAGGDALLNTITTPMGGTYHLTLADNTQVWLNAGSSITYPAAFTGHDRPVSITGEVYFEVAHDAAHPFKVTGRGQQIEVLGTHFNVNTYENEPENKTTLLEGSVRITAGNNQNILKPGQQAVISNNTISLKDARINEVMAWKNGYFEFENIDIQSLMRQIARWYDVDIQFEGPVSKETFTGRISRFKNISQILSIVQASNSVHLTVSGRRIMVKQ